MYYKLKRNIIKKDYIIPKWTYFREWLDKWLYFATIYYMEWEEELKIREIISKEFIDNNSDLFDKIWKDEEMN
jgi:hypothetical protein